jgi:hypothetical protein
MILIQPIDTFYPRGSTSLCRTFELKNNKISELPSVIIEMGGEVSMGGADTSPTSLIVHFADFHCTAVVPVTALNTKEFAR